MIPSTYRQGVDLDIGVLGRPSEDPIPYFNYISPNLLDAPVFKLGAGSLHAGIQTDSTTDTMTHTALCRSKSVLCFEVSTVSETENRGSS